MATKKEAAVTFRREQLLKAKKYADKKDLLNALLDGEKEYTIEQVDKILDSFLKGKV